MLIGIEDKLLGHDVISGQSDNLQSINAWKTRIHLFEKWSHATRKLFAEIVDCLLIEREAISQR